MDELNELPQGWKWVKLGDVCHIEMGQSPNGDSYNKNKSGLPLLNGPAEFGKLNPTPVQWTTEPTKLAEKGDILFCVRGSTTGRKNIADRCYCIGRGIASIRGVINKSDTTFLYLLLDQITEELLLKTSGSTFPNLSGENLKNFEIPFPELPEQQRLATLLTAKLALIEQAKEKITAQLQAAQALTAAYLREVFQSEEAKGWEWVKLSDLSIGKIKSGYAITKSEYIKNSSYKFININELYKEISINTDILPYISEPKETAVFLRKNDILFVRVSVKEEGVAFCSCFLSDEKNIIYSDNIFKLTPNTELLDSYFAVHILRSNDFRKKLIAVSNKTNLTSINTTNLSNFRIPLPSIKKQRQIVTYLTEKLKTVEQLKATLQTQLDSINQLPAALLKQAFKGEL